MEEEMEQNMIDLKKVLYELNNKNEPKYNQLIETLKAAIEKLTKGKEKNSQDIYGVDVSSIYMNHDTLVALKCIILLYKVLSQDFPLKNEHRKAVEILKDFVNKKSTKSNQNAFTQQQLMQSFRRLVPSSKANNLEIGELKRMREIAVNDMIKQRISQLETLVPNCNNPHLKLKGLIEIRALNLVEFQRNIRQKVLNTISKDATRDLVPTLRAIHKPKRYLVKDKYLDRCNNFQRTENEKRQRKFHKEFLTSLSQHCKDFKDFHRCSYVKMVRVNKNVALYHTNHDKEKKRQEERVDKERMRRLMMEDEEGYRKLVDEKKDHRIHYLLNQTDEFINSLMDLVYKHKEMRVEEDAKIELLNDDNTTTQQHRDITLTDVKCNKNINNYENDDEDLLLKPVVADTQKPIIDMVSYYKVAHSIGEEIKEQPLIMEGGELKEYQVKGLEWLVSLYNNKLNGILADEMGLGKTIQTIALFAYLMETKRIHGPHLIVVPLSTISNWHLEMQKWCPKLDVILYRGTQLVRKQHTAKVKSGKFNVLLTTYEYVMKDKYLLSKVHWKYMVVDEGHRMKNQDCKLTNILNMYYKAPYRLLLTGTPLQNRLPELWALLNFLLPAIFNSCTTFEQWFNAPFANTGERVELNEEETYLIIRRLHKILRPFLLRRLKKEVESQLPDKVEYVIKCHMSCLQRMLYQVMQKDSMLITNTGGEGGKIKPPRQLMNTIMQLRKVCNHPFLFHHIEESMIKHYAPSIPDPIHSPLIYNVSGKFEFLDRILPKLKIHNHRCLIFCQMTQLMSILEDYLCFANYQYLRLDGTTKADDRAELLQLFNAPDSPYFIFILSTRAGGLGLNLQSADTVIIFDSDWNPQQDLQAQDRAHRIGQKNEVRVLRLITINSVEEKILSAARFKLNLDEKVIQAGMFNQNSTSKQRKAFLEALLDGNETMPQDEDEAPDAETVNLMIARNEEEYELYQKMDEEPTLYKKPRLIEEKDLPTWIRESFEKTCGMEDISINNETTINGQNEKSTVLDEIADESVLFQNTLYQNNDESNLTSFLPMKRKKRGRPALPQRVALENLSNSIRDVIKFVKNYESQNHRRIYYVFYRLPTKKQLPDYYRIISNPIDIINMEKKVDLLKYFTFNQFADDYKLMVSNALLYNPPTSPIHQDAILMMTIFTQYCQQHSLTIQQ